ncbi:sugar phosphate nucleotidyltransferase [Methanoregula sp.]|uniref:sugar phosphate nucleotidyltransferase n=1 Tax=Methanoregula sp. TaxID=2052170 RepID=UPI0025E2E04A|nr:sugar phosphate nucleotidyltransferase [Methanoregula sp.]
MFPSDHLLGDVAIDQIKAAEPLAREYLVTFGVKPTSPHTGYGYSKPGKALTHGSVSISSRKNRMKRPQRTT